MVVVILKQHSSVYKSIYAEGLGIDRHKEFDLQDQTYSVHGSALLLITNEGFKCVSVISGLVPVEDCLSAIEISAEYLTLKSKEL